ncbi:hypothetical protein NQ318_009124 [Aromia moschata]|uniref:Uncharacterized protein n=1 Tax=Aromia moschata TaxID=1265417 RepID=A0AAV8XK14_9CUCU|nr:hypothetical protein NQ318_009124 [Aromia moschata]
MAPVLTAPQSHMDLPAHMDIPAQMDIRAHTAAQVVLRHPTAVHHPQDQVVAPVAFYCKILEMSLAYLSVIEREE